jgi:hypothetical protein
VFVVLWSVVLLKRGEQLFLGRPSFDIFFCGVGGANCVQIKKVSVARIELEL